MTDQFPAGRRKPRRFCRVANAVLAATLLPAGARTAGAQVVGPQTTATGNNTKGNPQPATAHALPGPAKQPTLLSADVLRYEGDNIIAEATGDHVVTLDTASTRITAHRMVINLKDSTVQAHGNVYMERTVVSQRRDLTPFRDTKRYKEKSIETVRGNEFRYNLKTQSGHVDDAVLHTSDFDLAADSLFINGRHYTGDRILLRPGGLTPAEVKVYGLPPFSLHARRVVASATGAKAKMRTAVLGASLYYKNTKLFPVPSAIFNAGLSNTSRSPQAFTVTPRLTIDSADGLLVTTRLGFPLAKDPQKLALLTDLGISTRIGFRGGLTLESLNDFGTFALSERHSDIVTTQLTNKIVLNRQPEFEYDTRLIPILQLPGGRHASLTAGVDFGHFDEHLVGQSGGVSSDRQQASLTFTTRQEDKLGPYLDLFARDARYSLTESSYRNLGFEIGYEGNLTRRIRGIYSYTSTSLGGNTPFQFDLVEIAREFRVTFDYSLSPRYIIPIDLRYDTSLHQIRDERFGLLRNYKTYAYGITYDTAQSSLRFEIRSGF